MDRYKLLAAELLGCTYASYKAQVGVGNPKYDRLMPRHARTLEQARQQNWPLEQVAHKLDIDAQQAKTDLEKFDAARKVVDAPNPAESFREGVRQLLQALCPDAKKLDELVSKVCYRASDLGQLLEQRGETLNRYSLHLRREPGIPYDERLYQAIDEDDDQTIS